MSDTLRNQLLNAGFAEPKKDKKPARRPTKAHNLKNQPAESGTVAPKPAQNRPTVSHTYIPSTKPKKQKSRKPPAVKPRAGSWSTRNHVCQTSPTAVVTELIDTQRRQLMNAKVKQLIEANELKAFMGDKIYRFMVRNTLRELLVTAVVKKQLDEGDLATTQLHGYSRVIPTQTAADISSIDPQWPICLSNANNELSLSPSVT